MDLNQYKKNIIQILENSNATTNQKLNEVCKLLQENVSHYDWVGFYFAQPQTQTLHLKAFAGKPTDHTVIPFGKGICGQVAVTNANFVVPDVTQQDNYIACSIDVKSEIVIPLFKNGKNIGQIDIDSNTPNAFSEKDETFLSWVNEQIALVID